MRRTSLSTIFLGFMALATVSAAPLVANAQATSRLCAGEAGEVPGPACLVAHVELGTPPPGPLYWNIYDFPDAPAATRAKGAHGTVVQAFGRVFLFDVGAKGSARAGGRHLSDVGPLPMAGVSGPLSVAYLKSTFTPGMTAPVHIHSGPEAFYAISGASCLETPDGAQVARGAGHALMIRQGPPMLLMAIGGETRQGFAMILHDPAAPPTTLTSDWTPKGLCPSR